MRTAPLLTPSPLQPGDQVAILSPSGPVLPEHLEVGLEALRAWGLRPVVLEQTFARSARGYLAGQDAQRLAALRHALTEPSLRAVIFSRGGYGAMRLLPQLDPQWLRQDPKLLVGFSDITALLMWAWRCAQVSSLHGPVIKSMAQSAQDPDQDTLGQLRGALFGQRAQGFTLRGQGVAASGPRVGHGPLLVANLSILTALLGTPYLPDLSGVVLILEDIGEEDYRLDRMMTSLRLHLGSRRLAGLGFGQLTDCAGAYVGPQGLEQLVTELGLELECPLVLGLPCGHEVRNVPLPQGAWATLDADAGELTIGAQP